MNKNLLLIKCKDEVGLVTIITRILADNQLNITAMREFVDEAENRFFTRIEFNGSVNDEKNLYNQLAEHLPEEASIIINPNPEKKIALLVTKEFHCLSDILVRNFFNTLGANVCCVIGNYETLRPFTERFTIPFHYVSHEDKSRQQFEDEIAAIVDSYNPDYLVLAKFMRILSPGFVARYPYQIINIHHSFLPCLEP